MKKIRIAKQDVWWGYLSQVFNVGANILILPALFYYLESEILGVWYVFLNIGTFATLFGLIFQSTFSRNISYAFAGATVLNKEGIDSMASVLSSPNTILLKQLIIAMRHFYGYISLGILLVLSFLGWYYIHILVNDVAGYQDIIYAWLIYSVSIALGFYCLHLGSILQGRGAIKELNILTILTRFVYIVTIYILIHFGYGIWSIALANLVSVLINCLVADYMAYKDGLRNILRNISAPEASLLGIIWSNTYKLCLATLFSYLSTKGNLFYVSLFLPLNMIASYGLTLQVVNVLTSVSLLYYYNMSPLVAQGWVEKDLKTVRLIYSKSLVILWLLFLSGSVVLLLLGNWSLTMIGSNTQMLDYLPLALFFIIYAFDSNHSLALGLIVSNNRVPHLWASLISAISIFLLVPVCIKLNMGIYSVIFSIGIVQLCYHNWKWPLVASHYLNMSYSKQWHLGIIALKN